MEQRELPLRKHALDVSDDVVFRCADFKEALNLARTVSGLNDKQFTMDLDIDPGQWSRIWSGSGNFPEKKIERFMELCGNIIPLKWLAFKSGFELKPLKSALEVENEALRTELEAKTREIEVIKKFLKETRA